MSGAVTNEVRGRKAEAHETWPTVNCWHCGEPCGFGEDGPTGQYVADVLKTWDNGERIVDRWVSRIVCGKCSARYSTFSAHQGPNGRWAKWGDDR